MFPRQEKGILVNGACPCLAQCDPERRARSPFLAACTTGGAVRRQGVLRLSFAALSAPRAPACVRADVVVCVVPIAGRGVDRSDCLPTYAGRALGAGSRGLASRAIADAPGAAVSLAGRLERFAATRADRVVVCSPGFEQHFLKLGVAPDKVQTILNWVDTTAIVDDSPAANDRAVRFLYSGNLGYTQGFETLAAAAAMAGGSVEIEIVGAGNAAAEVESLGCPYELQCRPASFRLCCRGPTSTSCCSRALRRARTCPPGSRLASQAAANHCFPRIGDSGSAPSGVAWVPPAGSTPWIT